MDENRHVGVALKASTIWFESIAGGVGKSVLAANAAFEIAALGHRVCLLELDEELPSIHDYFGLPHRQAAVLAGMRLLQQERLDDEQLQALCTRLVVRGIAIDFLSGFGLPDADLDFELLELFIEQVSLSFDYLVIDTAAKASHELKGISQKLANRRVLVVAADQVGIARLGSAIAGTAAAISGAWAAPAGPWAANSHHPDLGQMEIVLNRADLSAAAARSEGQLRKQVRDLTAIPVAAVIPRDSVFDEAASRGLPLRQVSQKSKALSVIGELALRLVSSL